MPIYEYICNECSHKFEAMRGFSQADDPIQCKNCGSMDTHRAVSRCFSKSGGSYTISTSSSGGGCAGCSGGNCAHCGH